MSISTVKALNEALAEPHGEAWNDDGLFGIASVSPKSTGLPFVVWITPSFGAPHDVRVWVSKGLKARSSELAPVAIRPHVRVIGDGEMAAHDLDLLKEWLALDRDVIIRYWDGDIESTEDALAAIKAIR
jgi:hypothetical protein